MQVCLVPARKRDVQRVAFQCAFRGRFESVYRLERCPNRNLLRTMNTPQYGIWFDLSACGNALGKLADTCFAEMIGEACS